MPGEPSSSRGQRTRRSHRSNSLRWSCREPRPCKLYWLPEMQFTTFLASLVIGAAVFVSTAQAQGFLGGQAGLDPKFCETTALRQTVVYVDDMFMQDGQTE